MSNNPVVLLCNHREKSCGVHQFGKRLFSPLMSSQKYNVFYIDIENGGEFDHWAGRLNPEIVVYNYYNSATMPWLTPSKIANNRRRFKQLSIFHEVDIWYMGFDGLLHQDPSNKDNRFLANLSRPIPGYRPRPLYGDPKIPTFGSFGFGLGGKGFTRIIDVIKEEYEQAIIRINIPAAAFGDALGVGARSWADSCRAKAEGTGIDVQVTHELLDEPKLIEFLAENTANCFFYDENYGRGISGTLDYALAAERPIAITRSHQFKHFWGVDERCLIENGGLRQVLAEGTDYLRVFHQLWGDSAVLRDFEAIFDKLRS